MSCLCARCCSQDGSAVVLFMWVKNVIGYDYATLGPEWMRGDGVNRYTGSVGFEFLRIVAQMLVFGILLGGAFGWVAVALLKRLYNQRYVEVSIVVTMSYLVFWLGELVMGSSAVLAVVAAIVNPMPSMLSSASGAVVAGWRRGGGKKGMWQLRRCLPLSGLDMA